MIGKEVQYLLRSSIARKILVCLEKNNKPLSPKQIAKQIDVARDNVSTRILKLAKLRLVECINPDVRLWRFYRITKKGRNVLRELNKLIL